MNVLLASFTLIAVTQCEHYADAIFEYGERAANGEAYAQRVILLHQMACEATSEDEFGGKLELKHCVYQPSGLAVCEFEVEREDR